MSRVFAIGEKYRERLEGPLAALGICTFWLPDNPNVDPRLSGHADLMLLDLGGGRVLTYLDSLQDIGLEVVKIEGQGRVYPDDARLCACIVGRFCIHDFRISDPHITGFERIQVAPRLRQVQHLRRGRGQHHHLGRGHSKGRSRHGIDVLGIRPGYIELEGFDTGFIGGASFKISSGRMAFTGRLDAHPDRGRIEDFLRERGVEPVYLTDSPAFDIGSAVPLTASAEGRFCP